MYSKQLSFLGRLTAVGVLLLLGRISEASTDLPDSVRIVAGTTSTNRDAKFKASLVRSDGQNQRRDFSDEMSGHTIDMWLCDPQNPDEHYETLDGRYMPKPILEIDFNVGKAINICFAPNTQAHEDGMKLLKNAPLNSLDWYKDIGEGDRVDEYEWLHQPAVENGVMANPITLYYPEMCKDRDYCFVTTMLWADFFWDSGEVHGMAQPVMEYTDNITMPFDVQFSMYVFAFWKEDKQTKTEYDLNADDLYDDDSRWNDGNSVCTEEETAALECIELGKQSGKWKPHQLDVDDVEGLPRFFRESFFDAMNSFPLRSSQYCDMLNDSVICPVLRTSSCCRQEIQEYTDCLVTEKISPKFGWEKEDACHIDCFTWKKDPMDPNIIVGAVIYPIMIALVAFYVYFEFFHKPKITEEEMDDLIKDKDDEEGDDEEVEKRCLWRPYKDSNVKYAQVLSAVAFLGSCLWWITLPMSLIALVLQQLVGCRRQKENGIKMISVASGVTGLLFFFVGIFELVALRSAITCSLFLFERDYALNGPTKPSNDECPEQIYATVSFLTGCLWLASAWYTYYFVKSGRYDFFENPPDDATVADEAGLYGSDAGSVVASDAGSKTGSKGILEVKKSDLGTVSDVMPDIDDDEDDGAEPPVVEEENSRGSYVSSEELWVAKTS